jgi:hypothetical protein
MLLTVAAPSPEASSSSANACTSWRRISPTFAAAIAEPAMWAFTACS